jgi:hypothetical protein
MHPHFGSSLLVGQHAEEIFSGSLEVLEVKNKLFAVVPTVPRINTNSKLPHVVFIFNIPLKNMQRYVQSMINNVCMGLLLFQDTVETPS